MTLNSNVKSDRGHRKSPTVQRGGNVLLPKSVETIPPDGGWGWLLAFGGCCNHCMVVTLVPTFSLIFASFLKEEGVSATTAAWIFNINQCVFNSSSFLITPFCALYGLRPIAICGGLILAISVILSGLLTRPHWLFLTFSILCGIGQGICAVIPFIVVANYFERRKGIATGIVSLGNCIGQFLSPLLIQFLMERYERQGTTLILGGIFLHACVIALLFHPVQWHSKKRKTATEENVANVDGTVQNGELPSREHEITMETENSGEYTLLKKSTTLNDFYRNNLASSTHSLEIFHYTPTTTIIKYSACSNIFVMIWENILLLKFHRVKILTISVALAISSYINFIMMVPLALTEKGYSLETISWCLSIFGFCNLIARILVTTLTDVVSFSAKYFFMMGTFGVFLSMIVFTLVTTSKMVFLTMALSGVSVGTCICLLSILNLEFMGLELLPSLLGLDGLLIAVLFLIVGPSIGAIRDSTRSFSVTIQLLSLVPFLSFCSWLLMPVAISSDKRREESNSQKRDFLNEKM